MLRTLIMQPAFNGSIDPPEFERRRHARYRLVERVFIRRANGSSYPATTSEISISGLSVTSAAILQPGEEVYLFPIVGEQLSAIVRRKVGTVYGFEFTFVPPHILAEIHKLCRGLLPFRNAPEP